MTAGLEDRAPVLERHVARLRAKYDRREELTLDQVEAFAEASFRLGIHPATDPAEALAHLYRGYQLDRTNPRYPYHLGRLYLTHGEFDKAAIWLTAAVELSPTSHRIWAHLSVVQRMLNERYRRQRRFEFEPDGLGKRADQISNAIRSGEDRLDPGLADIVPPPSRAWLEEKARQEEAGQARRKGIAFRERDTSGTPGSEQARSPASEAAVAVRLTDPGVCRWSGVHELDAEARFRDPTSTTTYGQLLPDLNDVAGLAAARRGGTAAFAVLAVEWLVCGYPAGTVRRLRAQITEPPDTALELLDLVCDLVQADEGELQERLARCLKHGRLPATLVALIHHRRLLWRPMTFPELGDYRAARRFLARTPQLEPDGRDGLALAAQKHVRALEIAMRSFDPAQPAPMREPDQAAAPDQAAPMMLDAIGATESLAALERKQTALADLRQRLFSFAKQDLEPAAKSIGDSDAFAAVAADCACARAVLDCLDRAVADLGREADCLERSISQLSNDQLGGGFHARLERLKRPDKLDVAKVMRRVDGRLGTVPDRHRGDKRDPSAKALELAQAVDEIQGKEPATQAGQADAPSGHDQIRQTAEVPRGAAEAVEDALARVDQAVDERFAAALATFAAYDREGVNPAPLWLLRNLVRGKQAETLYQLGRRREAQRIWYQILRGDRLNLAALKNLAVSHTLGGEDPQASQAWQAYLEALYFLDIAAGNPAGHAQERASIHRICGTAYGARSLAADPKKQKVNLEDVTNFLASAGRVESFSTHWQLAALNTFLGFRSPTLILGVSRSVREDTLAAARDRQLSFARTACAALPQRIRGAFTDLSVHHIGHAYAVSQEVRQRTLSRARNYEAEEELYGSRLKEAVALKLRVRTALLTDMSWATSEQSGSIIGNLRYLDGIELDPADDLVRLTVHSLGVPDPADLLQQVSDLSDSAAQVALKRIFEPGKDGFPEQFAERFTRIAESWVQNGVTEKNLDVLDDPQPFYGPSVARAFAPEADEAGRAGRSLADEALEELGNWSARFPRTTGPARLRATLLLRTGRSEEAVKILEEAQAEAFHPRAAQLCAPLLVTALTLQQRFARARDLLRDLIDSRPGQEDGFILLRNLYVGWLNASPATGPPSPDAVLEDFDRWLAAAESGELSGDIRNEAVAAKRQLLASAAVASCRNHAGEVDLDRVQAVLQAVRDHDPDNQDALYLQMMYGFQLCGKLREALATSPLSQRSARQLLRQRLEEYLDRAERLARELLAVSTENNRREEAEIVVTKIQHARS